MRCLLGSWTARRVSFHAGLTPQEGQNLRVLSHGGDVSFALGARASEKRKTPQRSFSGSTTTESYLLHSHHCNAHANDPFGGDTGAAVSEHWFAYHVPDKALGAPSVAMEKPLLERAGRLVLPLSVRAPVGPLGIDKCIRTFKPASSKCP